MARIPDPKKAAERRKVYEARKAGNSIADIAKILGKTERVCEDMLYKAVKVDKLPALDLGSPLAFEQKHPEMAGELMAIEAAAIVDGTERDEKYAMLRQAMKDAGLKPTMITGFMKRLRTNFAPVLANAERLTTQELIKQLESKLSLTLGFMDEFAVSQASFKDMSIALGLMIDRKQLLEGKPTMVLDHTTRLQIQESLPMLIQEAKRRGITIENPPQEKVIN